jgi:hypothetical protein
VQAMLVTGWMKTPGAEDAMQCSRREVGGTDDRRSVAVNATFSGCRVWVRVCVRSEDATSAVAWEDGGRGRVTFISG